MTKKERFGVLNDIISLFKRAPEYSSHEGRTREF